MTALERLLELRKKATQGEWRAVRALKYCHLKAGDNYVADATPGAPWRNRNDTDFIAALVNWFDSPEAEQAFKNDERVRWVEANNPIIFHKSSKNDQWEVVIVRPETGEQIVDGIGDTFDAAIDAAKEQGHG